MNDIHGRHLAFHLRGEPRPGGGGPRFRALPRACRWTRRISRGRWTKRRAGRLSTKRTEPDRVHFLSGVYKGFTTGTAVTLVIENTNTRSEDYEKTQDLLRPGHADWTAHLKYRGFQDAAAAIFRAGSPRRLWPRAPF